MPQATRSPRPLTYVDGIGAGLTFLALAVACYLCVVTPRLREMYDGFGEVVLPAISRLVLHPAWGYGVPIAIAGSLITFHLHRPRFALAALAVVAIALDVFWYLAAQAPIYALAGALE